MKEGHPVKGVALLQVIPVVALASRMGDPSCDAPVFPEPAKFQPAHVVHEDREYSTHHAEAARRDSPLQFECAARIAGDDVSAFLLEQGGDALIVKDATVS